MTGICVLRTSGVGDRVGGDIDFLEQVVATFLRASADSLVEAAGTARDDVAQNGPYPLPPLSLEEEGWRVSAEAMGVACDFLGKDRMMAQVTAGRGSDTGNGNPGVVTGYMVVAWLFVASVLVQAFLAGQGLYDDIDLIDVHGVVANLVFLLAVAQMILAFLATKGSRQHGLLLGLSGLLLVLTVAQIGIGYATENERGLGGWHIANGVLIMGLATAHAVLVLGNRR